jgi:thiamine pyrophosphokinase
MQALIIANGERLDRRFVRKLSKRVDLVVCADGGADAARTYGIVPDIILGDLDSCSAAATMHYRTSPLLFIGDQNSTDLEKAISYCILRKCTSAAIVGATGSRIDHTTGSLGCFKKFRRRITLTLYDAEGETILIEKSIRLRTRPGERISLIPLQRCTGVTTKNLLYPLRNESLELGVREGISNVATSTSIRVTHLTGTLLLYRPHQVGAGK